MTMDSGKVFQILGMSTGMLNQW